MYTLLSALCATIKAFCMNDGCVVSIVNKCYFSFWYNICKHENLQNWRRAKITKISMVAMPTANRFLFFFLRLSVSAKIGLAEERNVK